MISAQYLPFPVVIEQSHVVMLGACGPRRFASALFGGQHDVDAFVETLARAVEHAYRA